MNRNKLILIFASNISNIVVHNILKEAINKEEIASYYTKEMLNSLEIAKKYRGKINPLDKSLPLGDIKEIKDKIKRKTLSELNLRISKGYKNINLAKVDKCIEEYLKKLLVI